MQNLRSNSSFLVLSDHPLVSLGHSISSSIPDLVYFKSFKVSSSPGLLHGVKAHLFLHAMIAKLISLLRNYLCSLHREHIGHLFPLSPSACGHWMSGVVPASLVLTGGCGDTLRLVLLNIKNLLARWCKRCAK